MYTIIRYTGVVLLFSLLFANCLGAILFGTLARDPDVYHGYTIYAILSGTVVSTLSGGLIPIALLPTATCHGGESTREKRKRELVISITGMMMCGAFYFWLCTLISITAKHNEMVAIASVAAAYTIGMIVSIIMTMKAYRRSRNDIP